MLIGELARRLRVTPRTLRHYQAIGLLHPSETDPATGYRRYGADALARGLLIEQLKTTGMSLDAIREALVPGADLDALLRRRLGEIDERIVGLRGQRAVVADLLAVPAPVLGGRVVELPAATGIVVRDTVDSGELAAWIRRQVQRIRRRLRRDHGLVECTFAARIGLDLADSTEVEVAALAVDLPDPVWRRALALQVDWVGPHLGLPIAYDAALDLAARAELPLAGVVQETYLDLGTSPHTSVAVLIDDRDGPRRA